MPLKYSKEVMKNFMHPKNMGEIADADGVGKVGNPVCLLPNERVHTNLLILPIKDLKKNQKILTHEGEYEKIKLISYRNYKGSVISIKNNLGGVNLTPEHLIYAIKIPNKDKFKRNIGKRQLIPAWYHSEDLKKGDIILYPKFKDEKDIEYLEINIPKLKYDSKSKDIFNKIPLNKDLLKLFGYFLSKGNIQEKSSKNFISFTLNINEKDIITDIKEICQNLFNLEVKIKEIPQRNTTVVFLYNARLARWFKLLFGNGAQRKHLPEFIMNLPIKKQGYLIYGLWEGNGYVNLTRNCPHAGFVTISYQLAQQFKILLLRQDIIPSIYIDKEKMVNGIKHKESYRFHIGQRESLIKLCKILNISYPPNFRKSIKFWTDKNYLYSPILRITTKKYSGGVYNLEVENSHSFTSEAFCLHNCGDVMWVYIKVGKKKVGKKEIEYIKDIKFKTFGCAAAIATSSMITQIAKGKKLKDAEKITRDDVAKSLHGLPPIKMHCSNLASDALKKAIKDYEKGRVDGE